MPDNEPENVDLDELYKNLEPSVLQAILVKNLTWTVQQMCNKSVIAIEPLLLASITGQHAPEEQYQQTVMSLTRIIAIIKDINELINRVVPIHDEGMSPEQVEAYKESITRHPVVVEAAFRMSETVQQKLARKMNGN